MATSKLTINNGRITSYYDPYFVSLSEDGKRYAGNGWTVAIKDGHKGRHGKIVCHSEREYSDGTAVCHREFKLADGELGLTGGNVRFRYAFFRSPQFKGWLESHALRCVRHEDPNRVYHSVNPAGMCWSHHLEIETDGKVAQSWEGNWSQVTGATYAIVRQSYCDGVRWNLNQGVLYTLIKDVLTLDL